MKGPDLIYGQTRLLCGNIRSKFNNKAELSVIVVGSFNSRVQLLDKTGKEWKLGLHLPGISVIKLFKSKSETNAKTLLENFLNQKHSNNFRKHFQSKLKTNTLKVF